MPTKLEPINILIVDDREDGLLALEAALTRPDWRLIKASSGYEALKKMDQYEFAAILLDVQMPGIDGFETAELIRKRPKHSMTPILFVTAINKDDAYVHRGYEAGAVDYVFKPFDPSILRSKVGVLADLFDKTRKLEAQTELIRDSERRERYLRLAELEVENLRRYRSLADAIPHIIWKANADGVFDYVNRGWTDFTGLTSEQSQGSGWQSAIEPNDLTKVLRLWLEAMRVSKPFETEVRIKRADGEYRWHLLKAVPEILGSSVFAWIGTNTDIHDRKVMADNLIEAQREAESASQAKTNFLANMSHEIRTPLNAILGFAELMLAPDQTAQENAKSIATIRRSGHQLLKIINEILDISKVETGHMEVEKIEVDVPVMIDEVKSLLHLQAAEKGLLLDFKITSPIPRKVMSDPTRLKQILMNLVGNAVKFTAKGTICAEFGWEPENGGRGKLSVHVRDSGPGISVEEAKRLFQPFTQVDNSMTRKFGGTGLGLALSKQLANLLDGDVWLHSSEPGKGSVFAVEVNLEPAGENVEMINQFTHEAPVDQVTPPASERFDNLNILLVDDSPDNQLLVSRFLKGSGAKVSLASNGVEAVEKALAGQFDIVLMDIQMPYMDGYEATRRLRTQGYKKPILALTAHALKEERDRCLDAGCDGHLTKPVGKRALLDQVSHLLGNEHGSIAGKNLASANV